MNAKAATRALVRSLPLPVRTRGRAWYERLARQDVPPPPRVVYSPDVADAVALRALLRDTDVFGGAGPEADDYLNDGFERFRLTMSFIGELGPGARVLELGANPYFLTRLLRRRGYDVTCSNFFGDASGFGDEGRQVVSSPASGERQIYEFGHFNVERDRFPYEEETFDLVLCCEIIEHLPNDPIHMLAEIHRVLRKPNGMLLLTTPNAVRLENLLRMHAGENIYEELSGHGTYGRHNREYTRAELCAILSDIGYRVERSAALDIHAHRSRVPRAHGLNVGDRGDNLFVLARVEGGEPRWSYPRWLYSSRQALRRHVRPDVVMGINDDLQTAGFHELEVVGGRNIRWTGAALRSEVLLTAPAQQASLVIEGLAPPAELSGSVSLHARVGSTDYEWCLPCDGEPFAVRAEFPTECGGQALELWAEPTFVPKEHGIGADRRRLGVAVARVAFEFS